MSRTDEMPEMNPAFGGGQSESAEFEIKAGRQVGAGRFRLERMLGRGGMGTVWLALDERLNERVALKFISERIRGNPTALRSMRQETSRSHSLSHQNIVRIHDLHEVAGEPAFISMEFVDGKNLYELARDRKDNAFTVQEVRRWVQPLGAALSYAHSRGVIHRDLKPANLMLGQSGELKMADFGLATALRDTSETPDQSVSGTPAYMSPQQLSGAPGTVTDDIYSLGACLFELLSGRPVFEGPDLRRLVELEPAPWLSVVMKKRGLDGSIPEGLEDLLLQCLSKTPGNRPQSASEFLQKTSEAFEENTTARPARLIAAIPVRPILFALALGLAIILSFQSYVSQHPVQRSYLDLRAAPVRASSFVPPSAPEHAFDGLHRIYSKREETRWAASSPPRSAGEWISVDLGQDLQIDAVTIDWELAYAKDFSIRTRTAAEGFLEDPAAWTERGKISGFIEKSYAAINETEHQDDVIFDFARGKVRLGAWMSAQRKAIDRHPVIARYVMVYATAQGANNPRIYSIYEIEISAKAAH